MENRTGSGETYDAQGSVKSAFGERTDLISSVAFWYQDGIARDLPPIPYGSARGSSSTGTQTEATVSTPDVGPPKVAGRHLVPPPCAGAGESSAAVAVTRDLLRNGGHALRQRFAKAPAPPRPGVPISPRQSRCVTR